MFGRSIGSLYAIELAQRHPNIAGLIIESGIKKTFIVQARIDVARHPKILAKAEQAGFRLFLLGIESPGLTSSLAIAEQVTGTLGMSAQAGG